MLDEGRKRDAAANAVLALSFAANAAQSPQSLVSSGKVEAPGVAGMQRLMDPRKKRKDLDLQTVSHSARNKTFREFIEEAYLIEIHKTKADAAAHYEKHPPVGGDPYYIRNKGPKRGWAAIRKSSFKKQGERRKSRLTPMTRDELESHAKRTLRKNPEELSAIAHDREEDARTKLRAARKKLTKKTGVKGVLDHSQPAQQDKRKPQNRERFERVTPGDVASNLQVTTEPKNLKKGSKPPKKGQKGYGTTRSGAVKQRLDKAQKFSDKMDKLIAQVRSDNK